MVFKFFNWVSYVLLVWDLGDLFWGLYADKARSKIFITNLLACENQLTFCFLEYQGFEYTAGLEGILGTPRGISTILYGEMTGDVTNSNRSMIVMDQMMRYAETSFDD